MKTQKHFGLKPDKKLSFKEHFQDEFDNERFLTIHHSLVAPYKPFIRPHLDYADIIYDQPDNLNLCNKIEACSTTQL